MNKNMKNIPIPKEGQVDVVYIWCDANNPEYIENRKRYSKKYKLNPFWSPTRDHGEILHSIKSVRKNMLWVKKIYICCPKGHRVKNLDPEKYNVHYIDNEKILGEENCPNFNSHSLELYTHKIPGLSDFFLQCNDDFFVTREASLEDFYNFETHKIRYYYENYLLLGRAMSLTTQKYIHKLLSEKYFFWPTHMPRMFYKEDIEDIVTSYASCAEKTKSAHFRTNTDFQLIHFYGYYLVSKNRGEFIFVKNTTSKNNFLYSLKILVGKIFSENPISVIYQIYLQLIYKKTLFSGKQFLEQNLYSLVHVEDDYRKNRIHIDYALESGVKFICLNDMYHTSDSSVAQQIQTETYQYFYDKIS